MYRILLLALLTAAVALPAATQARKTERAGLNSSEKKKVLNLLDRYFPERDPTGRNKILKDLEALDHPSKQDIGYFTRVCFRLAKKAGSRLKGKAKKGQVTCTHPDYPGRYILRAPNSAKRRKTGLFIGLHGGGEGVGDGAQIERSFGKFDAKMINVYPTVVEKSRAAWNTEREEQYVLAIIEELKRTYRIDTNRIYIAGHSMGGFGAWSIAGRHTDVFAAASAMAGGQFGRGVLPNLLNLPFYFYHATDDERVPPTSDMEAAKKLEEAKKKYGPFNFVWKLYTGIGHGFPRKGVKPIFDWMRKFKRNPYPERILWERSRSYKTHFYWLKNETARDLIDVQRKGNEFTVAGAVTGTWIFLNHKMVDLKKPVVVRHGNSVLVNRVVAYSLVALAESIRARNDPEMYFTARIDLKPR